ncbi:hypothetical protein Ddye_023401 [Dipteronia dyeriana]|uniref:NAD(P)H dehydrogenase subunit H n=1 Tax=Dipteronia dyeriana TaxID=168575 RepID=A0AAD9TTH2_9ROSI|nr:hypothetical protein Ddye_023401 [Dipteronia dyeriana]
MRVNMGPHHPSMHGVLRLIVTLDGEDVIDCEPILGYLHRGMEKIAEELRFSSDYHSGRPDSSRRFTGRLAEELSARETEQVGIS